MNIAQKDNEESKDDDEKICITDQQKDDVKLFIRILQIFLHDLYAKIPTELEHDRFQEIVDNITWMMNKIFGQEENK